MDTYRLAWLAAGLVWVLGAAAAGRRQGLSAWRVSVVGLAAFAAVLAGARMHAQILEVGLPVETVWTNPMRLVRSPGDRLAGGMVAGTAVVVASCIALRLSVLRLGDVVAPMAGPALAVPFSRLVRFPGEAGLLALVILGFGHAWIEGLRDTTFQPAVPMRSEAPLIAALAAWLAWVMVRRQRLASEVLERSSTGGRLLPTSFATARRPAG